MHLKKYWAILLLIFIGIFLRFYNISWGEPYFFNPDERNIASAISQMSLPHQMNPHFFAYGGLPIYIIFLSGIAINFVQSLVGGNAFSNSVTFENAILISRFYSAILSTLIIPLLYLVGSKIAGRKVGLVAAVLGVFNVGFIQFAHFGTFEMWITFLLLLLFWCCINYNSKRLIAFIVLSGMICGVLLAIKISNIVFVPLPFLIILYELFVDKKISIKTDLVYKLLNLLLYLFIFVTTLCGIYFLSNPYVILDFVSFQKSIEYESGVGLGNIDVFYIGEFKNALPILFQFQKVLTFLINPITTLIFIPVIFFFLYKTFNTKNFRYFLLLSFFTFAFLSQAFLYVKWVRYIVPSVPFIILIFSLVIFDISKISDRFKHQIKIIYSILISCTIIFALSFFITTYVERDTRLLALDFANLNMPTQSSILSEVYDLGIVPFNDRYKNITLFNFYDLDMNSPVYNSESLKSVVSQSDFIILPSQRVHGIRTSNSRDFPKASRFYIDLISGNSDFIKIYETPCSVFCKILYLNNPLNIYEQTASVFDRPYVMIFKKI